MGWGTLIVKGWLWLVLLLSNRAGALFEEIGTLWMIDILIGLELETIVAWLGRGW